MLAYIPRSVFETKTSTVVVCDFNENMFVCSYMVCKYSNTWSVCMQFHLLCCVYARSSMEVQCLKTKPEANSPHDDKPSTGMFAVSDATLSALASCCGSVVSCGSVIVSPCKLTMSPKTPLLLGRSCVPKIAVLLHKCLTWISNPLDRENGVKIVLVVYL